MERLAKVVVWVQKRSRIKGEQKVQRLSLKYQYKCVHWKTLLRVSSISMVVVMTAIGATLGQEPVSPTRTTQTPA